jgi:drug/metabolite transporter (DMT)-like permease
LLNTAEEVSLFATLFVLMAGVVFMAAPDGPTHVALAWAVVIAIACAVVTCIYVAFK